MARSRVSSVAFRGVASAVPRTVRTLEDDAAVFSREAVSKLSASTGIVNRRWAGDDLCASDLCEAAARELLDSLGWDPSTIDLLIFVSQTGDHQLPATACLLHGRLGLSKSAAAFDIGLGCSGYSYGLLSAAAMMQDSDIKRALVLVGDTTSRIIGPEDRSVVPLFGDAGTATALEQDERAQPMHFVTGSDGTGAGFLMVPAGGARIPRSAETAKRTEREGGNIRSDEDLFMDGLSVFWFTLREVPPLIQELFEYSQTDQEDVSAWVLHQANGFMMEHIRKRVNAPKDKFIVDLKDWGNTSSASIPLCMTTALRERLGSEPLVLLLAGFGVGLSWSSAMIRTDGRVVAPPLVEVPLEDAKK